MFARRASLLATLLLCLLSAQPGLAHPMGNFSVNHYSKITLDKDRVRVQYVIDLAEISTYQELQQGGFPANTMDVATLHFVSKRGAEFGRGLSLSLNGTPLPLRLKSDSVLFPPGAGGLPTMKMGFVYEAMYPAGADAALARLRYADANYPGHSGWKEIVAVSGAGRMLKSSVPTTSRSDGLTNYPTDLLSSPPQDLEASFEATLPVGPLSAQPRAAPAEIARPRIALPRSAGPNVTAPLPASELRPVAGVEPASAEIPLQANRQATPRNRFTELMTEQRLGVGFLFTAAFIAMGLGGLHALEPGHGKTIVAAYLVGSRGTGRHALMLGLIVTATHTAAVFALGAITLYASHYLVPEQLYPWLGVLSGIIIAVLGGSMLLRRLTGTSATHDHVDGSGGHWPFSRRASTEQGAAPLAAKPVSTAQLVTLGITGGIVPCPAALVVLLSALALHRITLGLFLIVAFSMGLASVLIAFGMLMVHARRFMTRLQVDGPLTKRWLPSASAAFIMILGGAVAWQGFQATALHLHLASSGRPGQLLFVAGLGLILGMRHSTDADHVVAISTIVSKQRSVGGAALIGSVWGIGHTITIFIVGALIILFNVEIPARLGLSMEFSVAVMLVILGILNLTGVMQGITKRFTPAASSVVNLGQAAAAASTFRGRVLRRTGNRLGVYQLVRPLIIGLVHGLAGSAAVALLVLSTIHDPVWATFYLLIFGAGTMLGMMCMTTAIAVPLTYMGGRLTRTTHYLNFASGLASLGFGSFLVYQLGFLGGLFGSHPQWTPR